MLPRRSTAVAWALLATLSLAQQPEVLDLPGLEQSFQAWASQLDTEGFARGHPRAVAQLQASDAETRLKGLQVLAASGDPAAVPLIVPFLAESDGQLVIYAGLRLSQLVAAYPRKRWTGDAGGVVSLEPEFDLRPLAWVLVQMFALPDDGNSHAYACTMAGQLGLAGLSPHLRRCLASRHPAVTRAAHHGLRLLGASPVLSVDEWAAAEQTALEFAALFADRDEDGLGRLLVSREQLAQVLTAEVVGGLELEAFYLGLVDDSMARFSALRSYCGELGTMAVRFLPGTPASAPYLAGGVPMLKNSSVEFSDSERVQIRVKIEEMVLIEGRCFILKVD